MPPQTAKTFVSRATDRFRPPYGSRITEQPRQSVFAGSVNHSDYLRDETGARRFWPVACAAIDFDALGRDREQIWAETCQRYLTPTTDTPQGVSVVGVDKRAGDPDRKLDPDT